ncbi:MAG: Ferrochelatase, partial [Rhodopila sp.]|nr:Ferrochelatase [Rhodopila sp.]
MPDNREADRDANSAMPATDSATEPAMTDATDEAATASGLEVSPSRRRIAIVLFNLGGPDRPEAIKPFLLN